MAAGLALRVARSGDGPAMWGIIMSAFRARPALDPPADALSDTVADIESRIVDQVGIIASDPSGDIGCLFMSTDPHMDPPTATLHRVSVLPESRQHGVAYAMARAAVDLALDAGMRRMQLIARRELPGVITWWGGHGFQVVEHVDEYRSRLAMALPARIEVPSAESMRRLGAALAGVLRAGDLIVASGELGAGKTTFTQGLGEGLQVAGRVTSPTFVLSRVHPATSGRPQLVHVDAYRLATPAELEDLDLEASMTESVTLVEWGAGLAERLATERLEVDIERSGEPDDETRVVTMRGVGPRWASVDLWQLVDELEES